MISRNVDPPRADDSSPENGAGHEIQKAGKRRRKGRDGGENPGDEPETGVTAAEDIRGVAAEVPERAATAPPPAADGDPDADAVPDADMTLEGERLRRCVEALLFASPDPLSRRALRRLLREADPKQIDQAVLELEADLLSSARGFHLVEDSAGLRLLSVAEFAPFIARLRGEKRLIRLSPAAFETLAVIAYRQPIGRADLDSIRGVQSGPIVKRLHEWNLVHIVGRDDEKIGRPLLYGTTKLFLEQFGLTSLDDLPEPERFLELGRQDSVDADELGEEVGVVGVGAGWEGPAVDDTSGETGADD